MRSSGQIYGWACRCGRATTPRSMGRLCCGRRQLRRSIAARPRLPRARRVGAAATLLPACGHVSSAPLSSASADGIGQLAAAMSTQATRPSSQRAEAVLGPGGVPTRSRSWFASTGGMTTEARTRYGWARDVFSLSTLPALCPPRRAERLFVVAVPVHAGGCRSARYCRARPMLYTRSWPASRSILSSCRGAAWPRSTADVRRTLPPRRTQLRRATGPRLCTVWLTSTLASSPAFRPSRWVVRCTRRSNITCGFCRGGECCLLRSTRSSASEFATTGSCRRHPTDTPLWSSTLRLSFGRSCTCRRGISSRRASSRG